jgi:hypothetical protein
MKNEYDGNFYDRNGKRITMEKWCEESNSKYVFRKEVTVNGHKILTKWTGVDQPEYQWLVDHQFIVRKWNPEPYKPKVFVTYVWNEDLEIVHSKRYAKIEQAYEAHHKLIAEFESKDFGKYVPLPVDQLEEINGEESYADIQG